MNVLRGTKLTLAMCVILGLFTVRGAATQVAGGTYRDDHSTPVAVLESLYNAINRKEYVRAYSYWRASAQLPSFAQFQQGYATTTSVQLTTGTVRGDAGAGQFRYNVPVVLRSTQTDGTVQRFAGCYTLHLSNPSAQATPPFRPMAIEAARIRQVANNANTAQLLRQSCP